ncbi:MAG: tetratricopeptide repeat protein [Gammaproteobacteria bacterium]|nr:tetratricopeptide repeat protein [Gammaproteobacteria bacterium]
MKLRSLIVLGAIGTLIISGCTARGQGTLKGLSHKPLDVEKTKVEKVETGRVMKRYRQFLDDAPVNHPLYSDALNRLADLEMIEGDRKQFIDQEQQYAEAVEAMTDPLDIDGTKNYENAIALYENLLKAKPKDRRADWIMYQLSRAYEQSGNLEGAALTLQRLLAKYPRSQYMPESRFRLAELLYVLRDYEAAGNAYSRVLELGSNTPFYDKAVYKLGWALFKQEKYENALQYFFIELKLLPVVYGEDDRIQSNGLSQLQRDLLNDVFRAVNLCFSYLGGERGVVAFFQRNPDPRLEFEVFSRLGEFYMAAERIEDAAETYGLYVSRHPGEVRAAEMQLLRLHAYMQGKFSQRSIQAREEFVKLFASQQRFWDSLSLKQRRTFGLKSRDLLLELTKHYHARAQKTKKNEDYVLATNWYEMLVRLFPGEDTIEQQILLAELYYQQGDYLKALKRFEVVAYDLPKRDRSSDAAYSALLSYDHLIKRASRTNENEMKSGYTESALRFITWFPDDQRIMTIRSSLAERLFALSRFDEALLQAKEIVRMDKRASKSVLSSAYLVIGHIAFDKQRFQEAISSYEKVLSLGAGKTNQQTIRERISLANFKMAEMQQQSGDFSLAANTFLRSAETATSSDVKAKAVFDAATAFINQKSWKDAIPLLDRFLSEFPKHDLISQIHEKRVLVYQELQQPKEAVESMYWLAMRERNIEQQRTLLWAVAETYKQAENLQKAVEVYERYLATFKQADERGLEALNEMVALQRRLKNRRAVSDLYSDIVKYVDSSSLKNTSRGQYLAAQAMFVRAEKSLAAYKKILLTLPLKKSLARKQKSMKRVLNDFEKVTSYSVAEYSTASTHRVAEVYADFAKSVMNSVRPKGLKGDELEAYNLELEEQAYPFEEKAIELYQVNAIRIKDGLYDDWIKQSLASLSRLQPTRYGKEERIESAFDGIY